MLGSGRGSNFLALADAIDRGELRAETALVVSDVGDAGVLDKARAKGCEARHLEPGKFRTKLDEDSEARLLAWLDEARVDWVVLAGFMRILKGEFLRRYEGRVVNIHPSLLPSFPGLEAWKQALDYGVKFTGCTVHLVDQGIDTGPIVAQQTVPVLNDDTPESLHARIHAAEHELYPKAVQALVSGRVRVVGRRAKMDS